MQTVAVLFVFAVFVFAVARFGAQNERVAADQELFHLPTIRQFAAEWPRPNLADYPSATSPGYHLLLAAVDRYVSDNVGVLRTVGAVFGFALIGLLAWAASPRSAWLALPAAASVYVLSSTVWLLPENAAWALLTLALLLALRAERATLTIGSQITLAVLVSVRQTNIWAIAPFAAAVFSFLWWRDDEYAARADASETADDRRVTPADAAAMRAMLPRYFRTKVVVARSMGFAIMIAPALLVLWNLVSLWHGLTPPAFQPGSTANLPLATRTGGLAPAAPAMVLALLGFFGTPLLAWLWPRGDRKRLLRLAVIGAMIGLVIGVLPSSAYSFERRSGIWNLVEKLPTIAGRSPLIIGLAALGGVVAVLALARLRGRERLVLAVALAGFTAVQITNALVWQRYYEPFILLWLTLTAATPDNRADDDVERQRRSPRRRALQIAGLAALTAVQLAATVYTLRHAG